MRRVERRCTEKEVVSGAPLDQFTDLDWVAFNEMRQYLVDLRIVKQSELAPVPSDVMIADAPAVELSPTRFAQ